MTPARTSRIFGFGQGLLAGLGVALLHDSWMVIVVIIPVALCTAASILWD